MVIVSTTKVIDKFCRVYSFYQGRPQVRAVTLDMIPYSVRISYKSVPYLLTEWCKTNCNNAWGWYFDKEDFGNIGFADKNERLLFCMSNDYIE